MLLRVVLVYLSENDLRIGDKELSADIWIGYTYFLLFLSQLSQDLQTFRTLYRPYGFSLADFLQCVLIDAPAHEFPLGNFRDSR